MGRVVLGMIGLGTVGTGVVQLVGTQKRLNLKKVAVKNPNKERQVSCPIAKDVYELIDDPEIEILVEVMGGEQPALDYMRAALEKRKHIVTANKEVLAKHGPELFELARNKGVAIFCEASVAGGIPLISTLHKGLEANRLTSITGILNGTTNFILSQMENNNQSYESALAQAQKLGFAEADPTNDVEGHDVGYKLSILAALSYGRFVRPETIYKEGITRITSQDIAQAREFGYRIKLIGTANLKQPTQSQAKVNPKLSVRVHPMLVPISHPLAAVSGSNNGILVTGNAVGEIALVGPGAGQMPTASAIVGDILNLANALQLPDFASYFQPKIDLNWAEVADPGNWKSPWYLRLSVSDIPGVIGHLGTIFGKHNISISSIVQRGVHETGANIVILTHDVSDQDMHNALAELGKRDFIHKISNAIRIFKPIISTQ